MSSKKPDAPPKKKKAPPKPLPSIFISKDAICGFWFLVAAGAFVVGAVYAERLVAHGGLRPQFIGIGTPGSTVAPIPRTRVEAPELARELRESQTRLLIESIFNKSAGGLDAPDRCQRLMSPEVWQWVQEHLIDPQSDAFKDGKIHQKVSIQKIDLMYSANSAITDVEVTGQLIRTGVMDREIFNQVWSLRASVTWIFNPCLRDCGRYPLLCTSFGALEKPVSSTQRKLTSDEEMSLRVRAELDGTAAGEGPKTGS